MGQTRSKKWTITALLFMLLFSSVCAFAVVLLKKHHPKIRAASFAGISAKDDSILTTRLRQISDGHLASLPVGERVARIGKLFLSTPYVGSTLEVDSTAENLVINLHGLDCVTFYENALALARVSKKYPKPTAQNYADELTSLRYRDGKRDGYHSRLHYSTDYFANAETKGILMNVTASVGGDLILKDSAIINFMSTHPNSYKQIAHSAAEFSAIQAMENNLNAKGGFVFIPKANIASVESRIKTGDILGITTNLPGLDCTHTGVALKEADGHIHFLHASSLKHEVIVTELPLADYLATNNHQTGVIVMRPIEVNSSHR
jgi:hypothetical protein